MSIGTTRSGLPLTRYSIGRRIRARAVDAPITFSGHAGRPAVAGVAEKPLTQVAQLSIGLLMALLVLITVLAVAIAMYFVANWFARPIKLVRESMAEIAQGRFDHRIREQRKDEYGLLFNEFNQMAQALHQRFIVSPTSPSQPVEGEGDAEAGGASAGRG